MACGDAAEGDESSRRVVDAFAAARATFGIVAARRGAGGRDHEVGMSSAPRTRRDIDDDAAGATEKLLCGVVFGTIVFPQFCILVWSRFRNDKLARSWHRTHHRRHHRAFHAEPHEGVLVAARHVRALVWQLLAQRIHRLPDSPLTAALAAPEAAVAPMRCRHAMCERCHALDAQDGAFFVVEPESGRYVHPGLTLCLEACLLNLVRTVEGAMRRPTASAAASVELATTRSMSARSRWPEPSESNLSN